MSSSKRVGTITLSAEILADIQAAKNRRETPEFTDEERSVVNACLEANLCHATILRIVKTHCGSTFRKTAFRDRITKFIAERDAHKGESR